MSRSDRTPAAERAPFPGGEEKQTRANGWDPAEEKRRLREKIREKRRGLSRSFLDREAEALLSAVGGLAKWAEAQTVMAYAALPGEPDLTPILREILSSGRRLILPRCQGKALVPCLVRDLKELSFGTFHILEPGPGCPTVPPEEIELLLLPGLAFDRWGFRLGQGGGFYDRFLTKTRGYRLGICHEWELLDAVPRGRHDQRASAVMTEHGVFWCGEEEADCT